MIEHNLYPIRKTWITRLPSLLPSPAAMHYPQLVSTTCVSARMIAIGAMLGIGPVAVRRSSRAITCRIGCLTHASLAWRRVWRAAAMLLRQPCSRSGARYTIPHPGHGGTRCARDNHRVSRASMRYLGVAVLLHLVRACALAATAST